MKDKIIRNLLKTVMATLIVFFSAGFVIEVVEGVSVYRTAFSGYMALHFLKMYIQDTMECK